MQPSTHQRTRTQALRKARHAWKWFAFAVVMVVALTVLYVVAANLLLRSRWMRAALNKHPDKFFIEWESASTLLPGSFHFQGIRFVGQGSRDLYYGRVDDARFRVELKSLLKQEVR